MSLGKSAVRSADRNPANSTRLPQLSHLQNQFAPRGRTTQAHPRLGVLYKGLQTVNEMAWAATLKQAVGDLHERSDGRAEMILLGIARRHSHQHLRQWEPRARQMRPSISLSPCSKDRARHANSPVIAV